MADSPQDAEGKRKKVQVTVRMPPELHSALSDYVYEKGRGLPPRERPSADSIIQEAIAAFIRGEIATEDPYVNKLRTILETGTEREREALKKGIDLILSPAAASQPVRGRRKAG